jgi:hypothetical protein
VKHLPSLQIYRGGLQAAANRCVRSEFAMKSLTFVAATVVAP